ncbi:hypothetical protein Hamer_G030049, partial [Homarus americanus]
MGERVDLVFLLVAALLGYCLATDD